MVKKFSWRGLSLKPSYQRHYWDAVIIVCKRNDYYYVLKYNWCLSIITNVFTLTLIIITVMLINAKLFLWQLSSMPHSINNEY